MGLVSFNGKDIVAGLTQSAATFPEHTQPGPKALEALGEHQRLQSVQRARSCYGGDSGWGLVEDFSSTSGRVHWGVEGGRYSVSRLHTGATVGAMDTASWDAVGERTV